MANIVSGFAGYNYYLSDGGTPPTYTKLNITPQGENAPFIPTGLTPNTDYSNLLFVAPVDNAGNERTPYTSYAGLNVKTLNPTPVGAAMNSTLTAGIDALAARCLAAGAGPGFSIGIDSPSLGTYNQSYGVGFDTTSHYGIASQTKTFTGYVIMRMIDAGLLHLSDHLSQYLSGYAVDPTIQQMMMMQSGIFDYEQGSGATTFEITPTAAQTVDQMIATIKAGTSGRTATSEFQPGTKYYYTNSNYYVLAKIAEAVDPTGRTIDQIITQDLFTPLGMADTNFPIVTGTPPAPYIHGYDYNPILNIIGFKVQRDVSKQNPNWVWASGAITSNIVDMLKWGRELRDATLISPASRDLLMNTWAEQPNPVAWGLSHTGPPTFGYGLGRLRTGSWYGHDGSWLGYDSCTMFEPQTGTVITVAENWQTTAASDNLGLGLLAITLVFYEIANYLYPGSANQLGFMSGSAASGIVGTTMKKMTTSMQANVFAPGTIVGTFNMSMKKMTTAITATDTPQPVSYDATGPGANNFATVISWDHVVANGPSYLIVDVECNQAPSCTVTCAGTAMTLLDSYTIQGNATIYRFGLAGVPAGTQHIIVTPNTNTEVVAQSVSYDHVVTVGDTQVVTGAGTAAAQTVSCDTGQMIVQGFFVYNSYANGIILSGQTGGTARYNHSGNGRTAIALSDSTVPATFDLTINASHPWVGFATVLEPV